MLIGRQSPVPHGRSSREAIAIPKVQIEHQGCGVQRSRELHLHVKHTANLASRLKAESVENKRSTPKLFMVALAVSVMASCAVMAIGAKYVFH